MNDIVVAVLTGGISLVGTVITVVVSNNSVKKLMEYRIEQVEKRIEQYGNLSERMALMEKSFGVFERDIKTMWGKIDMLIKQVVEK